MSCSARLPVYILIAGTFFAAQAGAILFGLYVVGILLAVVTARLLRRFLFPVDETPFVMELPPYRLPTGRTTLRHMWDKGAQYLRKMGGMILIASVVIWFLSYYPRPEAGQPATYEHTYLGHVGKACEPLVEPLGLNWKAGVALLSGVAAKEIVVSTIGVLYAGDEAADQAQPTETLQERLQASGDFSTAAALAFLIFMLIYVPCIATIAAIGAEAGWGWATVSVLFNTLLAWVAAYGVYHLMSWF